MCGISVVVTLDRKSSKDLESRQDLLNNLDQSLTRIDYRGPDCRGYWISDDQRVAFGHARLSIQDLSFNATQPLSDLDESVHAVINGEFYSYDSLRTELSAGEHGTHHFRTASDSELLIALYKRDGINCLSHLRGEFAFVLYDSKRQLLFAARDRFGVKPLFWTIADGKLLIASEAKALIPLGWRPEWDVRSLVEDGWLHDERTLFRGVRKILPGHYLTCASFDYIHDEAYYEVDFADKTEKVNRSEDEMITELRRLLYQSVALRTQGDVPIGCYLSGGLDSALIAGILADVFRSNRAETGDTITANKAPFTCFSVGFAEETEFDEMPIAQRTANQLGVPFVAQRLDEETFAKNFEATTLCCEHHNPDLNSVAKFILSKLAADRGVKVVLSGEGADEHFGGYSQFMSDAVREPDLTHGEDRMAGCERQQLTAKLEQRTTPGYKGVSDAYAARRSSLARHMLNDSHISACLWTVTIAPFAKWTGEYGQLSVQETRAFDAGGRVLNLINTVWHPLHTAQYIWTKSILPNLILTSMGDRMEMAHSIEGRTPFLDHELTHFANHLPPNVKVKVNTQTGETTEKWILREAARPYITQEIYERKKHPFTAPHKYQIGGPLHKMLCRLLTRENIAHLGFVDIDEAGALLDKAFHNGDQTAMRAAFVVAQWVVLSREFEIPEAVARLRTPEATMAAQQVGFADVTKALGSWNTLLSTLGFDFDRILRNVRIMF